MRTSRYGQTIKGPQDLAAFGAVESDRGRKWFAFVIKLVGGASLLAFLLWRYDLRLTFGLVWRERPFFFGAAVALFVGVQMISGLRWQLVARINGIGGRYRDYLAYYFIGMFANVFLPGMIGGDALRALYLGRRHNRVAEAVASVVADRGAGILGLFWFAAVMSLCMTRVQLPESVVRVTLAVGTMSLLAYLGGPVVATKVSRLRGLRSALTPLMPYLRQPISLAPAIALSVFLQFSFAVCQYLLGLGLRLEIPLTTFLLIVPITNVIASIPVTINGLGLREASYLVFLAMAGVSKDNAVALSILYFGATMVSGLVGIVPWIMTSMPGSAPELIEYGFDSEKAANRRSRA